MIVGTLLFGALPAMIGGFAGIVGWGFMVLIITILYSGETEKELIKWTSVGFWSFVVVMIYLGFVAWCYVDKLKERRGLL